MAAPELTANTDGNPWVEVFFDPAALPAGAARITVWRLSEGRTWMVRGGVNVATGVAVIDPNNPVAAVQ